MRMRRAHARDTRPASSTADTTRLGGMTTPPWREITTDDYHWRTHAEPHSIDAWMAQAARIRDLLQRQIDGEFRLRLVLRGGGDPEARRKRGPDWGWG